MSSPNHEAMEVREDKKKDEKKDVHIVIPELVADDDGMFPYFFPDTEADLNFRRQ